MSTTILGNRRRSSGFTLIELLVVVLILGLLTAIAIPSYISSVYASRQSTANANARALATAVQSSAVSNGFYDPTLSDYAADMGGAIPANPCSTDAAGYTITVSGSAATVKAHAGSNCGTWMPTVYSLTL